MPLMMPDSSSSSNSNIIKRACDCCHKRKVKCIGDGTRPCKNCAAAALTCTYNAVPQKKGPKGSRAKVISELRETQRQTTIAAATKHGFQFEDPLQTTTRTPNLVSRELVTACVDYFFQNMYPTQPILHRTKVGETIGQMETNLEAYCLATSLCAYVLIQPKIELPAGVAQDGEGNPVTNSQLGHILLAESLRVRKGVDYVETPSIWSVIISFFLFGSYFCLDKHNTAWFHLREATTLAHVMDMHEEETYRHLDIIESSRRRRLYWLLFVTERAYALQRHHPLTLHAVIELPSLEEDPAETVELSGFIHLVTLFRPFGDTFVGLWNKTQVGCSTEMLATLQSQLSDALPTYLQSTEAQAVDLRISQQWLKTMIWQLSIGHGFLSSVAPENSMSLRYPIEISRDLIVQSSTFSQTAMEIHGIGLVEKLFDVACTLADVMTCVPIDQYSFEYGPRDYLHQFLSIISSLRGGRQRYFPLLLSKINDTLPSMPLHGYSLTANPGHPHSVCAFDSQSQAHSSNPNSNDSTPYCSPPQTVPILHQQQQQQQPQAQQPFDFEGLSVNSTRNVVCAPQQYPGLTAVSGVPMPHIYGEYSNMPISVGPVGGIKYENGG